MRGADMRAVGEVAGEGLRVLNSLVRDVHKGIAGRVFDSIGPAAKPVELVHDSIAQTVYTSLSAAARRLPAAGGALASRTAADDSDAPLDENPVMGEVIASLNGIYGDELAARGNELATVMAVRVGGRAVELNPPSLSEEFPNATPRLAVLVHGLCQTERSWWRAPRDDDGPEPRSYGDRLLDDLGYTPVYVRYNTGLHISTNGHHLDDILTTLMELWPVPVEDIALIGHSMGGLVARSASHYGHLQGRRWTQLLRTVVCLGTPHLGADLEKSVNAASWGLAHLPETRGLARFLNRRSDGIKDLRYGACLDEDWGGIDPDELLHDRCGEVPFLPHASYHFVATTAAPATVGRLFGDHLVRPASASGRGRLRSVPFDADDGLVLTGLHHFDLLNHPQVYEALRRWLANSAGSDDSASGSQG